MYTGLRRGELLGLEWSDIDYINQVINIERNSLYLPKEGVYQDTTKNTTSNRVIKVSQGTLSMLKEYQVWQKKQRLLLGNKWVNTNKLFTKWNGEPMHPDTLSGWFHKFVKKNDLPDISIHSLRHTNATLLIANGIPLKTVSSRLGHANITTTGNIYTHAIKSADEKAAELIDDIFHKTIG